jgi:chromosome segregation ATPase
MSNETKTPRERLRAAVEAWRHSDRGLRELGWELCGAARAVLAETEPARIVRAMNARQAERIAELEAKCERLEERVQRARDERDQLSLALADAHEVTDTRDKRIAELESERDRCRSANVLYIGQMRLKDNRIAELETKLKATREDADENFRQMEMHGKARSELEAELDEKHAKLVEVADRKNKRIAELEEELGIASERVRGYEALRELEARAPAMTEAERALCLFAWEGKTLDWNACDVEAEAENLALLLTAVLKENRKVNPRAPGRTLADVERDIDRLTGSCGFDHIQQLVALAGEWTAFDAEGE